MVMNHLLMGNSGPFSLPPTTANGSIKCFFFSACYFTMINASCCPLLHVLTDRPLCKFCNIYIYSLAVAYSFVVRLFQNTICRSLSPTIVNYCSHDNDGAMTEVAFERVDGVTRAVLTHRVIKARPMAEANLRWQEIPGRPPTPPKRR